MPEQKMYDGEFEIVFEKAEQQHYPIRPKDIPAGEPGSLLSTFGKREIETAAEKLILFFQNIGYWKRFKLEELHAFYSKKGWQPSLAFYGLMGASYDDGFFTFREPSDVYVAIDLEGYHYVTDRFIGRCANAADPGPLLKAVGEVASLMKGDLGTPPETKPN